MAIADTAPVAGTAPLGVRRLWQRELHSYPSDRVRFTSLGIVVVATVILYYQFYMAGALATHIISDYHMSFLFYVNVNAIGYLLAAVASLLAGEADRYGRANIVAVGLVLTGLLCLFAVPHVHSKLGFGGVFMALGFVEGIILVATAALIRDFSPQAGRATAMGFWTLSPVLGSLVVSLAVSNTSDATAWQDHYIACGVAGLVVAAIAIVGLRELAPSLRDQLMVSTRDRVLVEARASGVDIEASLKRPFRQMLKPDIIASAFASSVLLIIFFAAVGFMPVFFQTVYGYSQSKANGLGNYFWIFAALTLAVVGFVSDRVRVRKPFMLIGGILAAVFTAIFAVKANQPDTSYSTFVLLFAGISCSIGMAYAPWMAAFTETVERRNPALTATGLAVWGMVFRIVIAASVFVVPHIVSSVTTLVDKGTPVAAAAADVNKNHPGLLSALQTNPAVVAQISRYGAQYGPQLTAAAKLKPETAAALQANPNDPAAQVEALSELSGVPAAEVAVAVRHQTAITAAQALDPTIQTRLLTGHTNQQVIAAAIAQIKQRIPGSTVAQAQGWLVELEAIPTSTLLALRTDAPKITAAVPVLRSIGKIPANVVELFGKTGPAALGASSFAALTNVKDRKLQADLAVLGSAEGKAVAAASRRSSGQWQKYWWIAVGGEVVFISLIFVMAGLWDPRRARRQEQEHEAWLASELARLRSADAVVLTG